MGRVSVIIAMFAVVSTPGDPQAASVERKLASIQSRRAPPGSVVSFTTSELNAWGLYKLPQSVPHGVRNARLELGNGTATAYGLVDFLKLRRGESDKTPWLIAKLIEGEKPVKVTARIQSANGRCTVTLQLVEISGLGVSGATLDFMVRNFFLPLYPNAQLNQPFELADGVDRLEVTPSRARVYITGRKR